MSQVLDFRDVNVRRNGRFILDSFNWTVEDDQRWVVIGPNGAGKTTVLRMAATIDHPTSGAVTVLDQVLGRSDLFEIRPLIGFASTAMARRIPFDETVMNVVMTAAYSVTGRWNEQYDAFDEEQARAVLAEWKLEGLAERMFGTLSDGEQKRVQIARAAMTDPEVLLLDEPTASLDLGAREELLQLLSSYAQEPGTPAIVMVTHHVEEIPVGFTHVLMLNGGHVVAQGPMAEAMTEANLSETFGMPIRLTQEDGRYAARAI